MLSKTRVLLIDINCFLAIIYPDIFSYLVFVNKPLLGRRHEGLQEPRCI